MLIGPENNTLLSNSRHGPFQILQRCGPVWQWCVDNGHAMFERDISTNKSLPLIS